jgi:hypothetical protein
LQDKGLKATITHCAKADERRTRLPVEKQDDLHWMADHGSIGIMIQDPEDRPWEQEPGSDGSFGWEDNKLYVG